MSSDQQRGQLQPQHADHASLSPQCTRLRTMSSESKGKVSSTENCPLCACLAQVRLEASTASAASPKNIRNTALKCLGPGNNVTTYVYINNYSSKAFGQAFMFSKVTGSLKHTRSWPMGMSMDITTRASSKSTNKNRTSLEALAKSIYCQCSMVLEHRHEIRSPQKMPRSPTRTTTRTAKNTNKNCEG